MKTKFYLAIMLLIGIVACSKDDISREKFQSSKETRETILGRKLENPYSVENMRRALSEISIETRAGVNENDIQATHYYVKFMPQSEMELDLLKQDTTLILYPYPLDYEIEYFGAGYHDPSLPQNIPTYQYASIEVGKWNEMDCPVKYEILEELFIPDEDKDNASMSTRATSMYNEQFIDMLVDKALFMTGNIEDEMPCQTRAKSKWRPAGRITYYDDALKKTIGLEGIKVKARRWFTTHTGVVNAEGYYSCDGTFKRPANYSFDFELYDFHVKGDGVRTDFDGPKKTGNWDYHFARSTSQTEYFAATVFRAAYHYYYKNIDGLHRPPMNSFWRTQMKLKAYNETSNSNGNFSSARRFLGLGSAIKLYNPSNTTMDIYATTIHELSHAAHWRMIVKEPGTNRYRDYHNAEDRMVESWAAGVQWYLTKMIYPTYNGKAPFGPYRNVVMDMIDGKENDANSYGITSQTHDKVSGYTITQIEMTLPGCNTWDKWKNNIKQKYNNATEQYLDQLFDAWERRNN